MAADSPSVSERYGRFPTLSARLDDLDNRAGARGWTTVGVTDDNAADLAGAVAEGFSVLRIPPFSPPPSGLEFPNGEENGPFFLVGDGMDLTELDISVDGEAVEDDQLFSAGRFPDWNGVETYLVVPWSSPSGWKALPQFSASGAPESTFVVQVSTEDGVAPLWFLSD